jgi:RNase P/RNase MRP subunit p29
MLRFLAPAVVGVLLTASAASAAAPLVHIRGTVVATTATSVTIRTATGIVRVPLAAATLYAQVLPSSRSAITPNTFVGIASNGDAPGAKAREVVVFPEAGRGTGEGHYGWDLPGGGNMMTNGTVAAPKSMMTNGTVATAAGANGALVLNVTYKGGSNRITVPPGTPVVTFGPGSRALLVKGAHVIAFVPGSASAPGTAARVLVGKGDLVPPM